MSKPYTPHRIAGNCLAFLAIWTLVLLGLHEIRHSPTLAARLSDRFPAQYLLLKSTASLDEPS
ncbi:MAG TPA: hypothetical protein V6D29_12175 [Leptolyngbyaceae cyanobacterium]